MPRQQEDSPFGNLDTSQERRQGRGSRRKPSVLWPILLGGGAMGLVALLLGTVLLLAVKQEVEGLPADDVDLARLLADWKTNPVQVIERHRGRAVRVTGTVRKMDTNIHSQAYVLLSAGPDGDTMMVYLLRDHLVRKMARYPTGSTLTAEVVLGEPRSSANGEAQHIGKR